MKILRLRLSNINSLRGSHEIDFTREPFSGSGLFAITGPTGAGKSTLLDAITLALYGRAARYGTQRSPDTVMSRHTGECSAEVEFSCAVGVFRSVWQLRRARKNPAGELQQPRRRVIELPGEIVLCEKIDQSESKIIELTGLDYDRFLRSVLLAQGDFAAFLKASAKDRTDLLQLVTGTAIYQEISRAAYRESEAARTGHARHLARHEALPLLQEIQRIEYEQKRDALNSSIAEATSAVKALSERLEQAQRWLEYETTSRQLAVDQATLNAEVSSASPQLQRLTLHEQAAKFASELATFDQQTREQTEAETRIRELDLVAPELEMKLRHAETSLAETKEAFIAEETRLETSRPLWDAVDELDKTVFAARESVSQAARQRMQGDQNSTATAEAYIIALNKQAKIKGDVAAAAAWLNEHALDGSLAEKRITLEAAFARWYGTEQHHSSTMRLHVEAQSEVDRLVPLTREAKNKQGPLESAVECRTKKLQEAQESLCALNPENIEASRDAAQNRRGKLENLADVSTKLCRLTAALEMKRTEASQLTQAIAKSLASCAIYAQCLTEARKLLEARQIAHSFAERLQSLEGHRASLMIGEHCPLCGAVEHPFASPGAQLPVELAAARRDLSAANQSVKEGQEALSHAENSHAHALAEKNRIAVDILRLQNEYVIEVALWQKGVSEKVVNCSFADTDSIAELLAEARVEEARLVQQITHVRIADTLHRESRDAAQNAQIALDRQRALHVSHQALLGQATNRLAQLHTELTTSGQSMQSEKEKFAFLISPFTLAPDDCEGTAIALEGLKRRADQFAQHRAESDQLNAAFAAQSARMETLSQQVEVSRAVADAARVQEESTRNRLDGLEEARRRKFGVQVVADARQEASNALKMITTTLDTSRATVELHRSTYAAMTQAKAGLEKSIALRKGALQAIRIALTTAANAVGFVDLDAIRAALLPSNEVIHILTHRRILEERHISIESRAAMLENQRGRLAAISALDATNFAELTIEKQTLETVQADLYRSFGAIDESLKNDDVFRVQQTGIAQEIETAHREFLRWDRLRALIGSADGSAFARFAQGLTLERLVNLANCHLEQFSPRYLMRRAVGAATEDLELEIVDRFQAGISRPMRSLSGGESFLVSLALALGLSELASGTTTIESIFIDEGFGTLDADTLETAMAALENLQARGKTIGIISHVAAMQDRIRSQIRVLKVSAGCSRIEIFS